MLFTANLTSPPSRPSTVPKRQATWPGWLLALAVLSGSQLAVGLLLSLGLLGL